MVLNKSQLIILCFFAFFGVVFILGVFEEAFHVATGEGAKSVCWDFNKKIDDGVQKGYLLFHTEFDTDYYDSDDDFYEWVEYNEKVVGIIVLVLYVVIGFLLGVLANNIYHGCVKK